MAIAIAVYACELLRDIALPIAVAIGEDIGVVDVLSVIERFRELVGAEVVAKLGRALDEALSDEVRRALNTDDLERDLPMLVEKFWARISLPLVELNATIRALDVETLKKFRGVEEELARIVAKAIKGSGYVYSDNLVYALSILVDRDLWVLDKVSEIGFDNLVRKLVDRALDVVVQLTGYTACLTFAWIASTSAVLGIVKEFRERNRDVLAVWCREYAEEIDRYLDTLDLLLDDEVYEDLVELGIVKRGSTH